MRDIIAAFILRADDQITPVKNYYSAGKKRTNQVGVQQNSNYTSAKVFSTAIF